MTVVLHVVRHGQTAYNRDGLGLGRADVPLTALGRRQAAAAAARLAHEPLTAIFSSPLTRCLETARAIAGERDIPIEPRPELIELDVGETEGLTFAVMRERFAPFLREWAGDAGHHTPMPGGESLADVDLRVGSFLEQVRGVTGPVAVVTHNFVTRLLVCRALGLEPSAFRTIGIDLASITTVVLGENRALVRRLNDRCHLDTLEP